MLTHIFPLKEAIVEKKEGKKKAEESETPVAFCAALI